MSAFDRIGRLFQRFKEQRSSPYWTNLSSDSEPKKVVVRESLGIAIRQCLVHMIPIIATVALITVNLRTIYIGVDLPGVIRSDAINILLLQLAAKAHEILIVTSFGVIILHRIRHELLFGDGLPLGLIGSGFTFNNFEFFFKKEFYGALRYTLHRRNRWEKIQFTSLLIVCGLASALSGPASAVLLVPKSQDYPAGGTDVYLNGSSLVFWPEDLTGDIFELRQYCNQENSAQTSVCPAGGFMSLQERWTRVDESSFASLPQPLYAKPLSGSEFFWPSQSPRSGLPPLYALGGLRLPHSQPQTWVVQAHAASAAILQQVTADWWTIIVAHVGVNPTRIDDRNVQAFVKSAISNVACTDAKNLSSSDRVVHFPTISGRGDFSRDTQRFEVSQLQNDSVSHPRFSWVHLPKEFGPASIGAVFEAPWPVGEKSRTVVGCTAQLGWVPSTLKTDAYSFYTGWYPWGIFFGERTPTWTPESPGQTSSPINGRVALGDEWLKLLNPPTPNLMVELNSAKLSTMETILLAAGLCDTDKPENGISTDEWLKTDIGPGSGKTQLLEAIIASVLVDGLSRSGSHRLFNVSGAKYSPSITNYSPKKDFKSNVLRGQPALEIPDIPAVNLTTIHATMELTGFAIRATLGSYIAMGVLLIHVLVSTTHMAKLFVHRRIFCSWANISELIALAHNSQPTKDVLLNTGGGIRQLGTFSRMARIRAQTYGQGHEAYDRIELAFEDLEDSHVDDTMQDQKRKGPRISVTSATPTSKSVPKFGLSVEQRPRSISESSQQSGDDVASLGPDLPRDSGSTFELSLRNDSTERLTTTMQQEDRSQPRSDIREIKTLRSVRVKANTMYG